MAVQLTFEELFDPEFLDALETFNLRIKRFLRQGRLGEQVTHDRGIGLEFKDFKQYVAGDDLRAVDWNIYRRLGRLFVHVFEEYQDLPLYLLVDRSRSMFLEDAPRVHAALRSALALSSIALSQHDVVALLSFSDELEMHSRPIAGKRQLTLLGQRMVSLSEQEGTQLSQSIHQLAFRKLRPGLLVILSDFFDPQGLDAVTDALKTCRHKILLVQLVKNIDSDPTQNEELVGDIRLVDCETTDAVDVSVEPAVLNRYRRIYGEFNQQLTSFSSQQGIGLVRLNADEDVLDQLAGLFESGALMV